MALNEAPLVATDLTMFFGAESYIEMLDGGDLYDPAGAECLAALIDILVNSKDAALTLPKGDKATASKLAPAFAGFFRELQDGSNQLLDSPSEAAVASAFNGLIASAPGLDRVRQWVQFQLCSPIVNSGHVHRLGGTVVSTPAWKPGTPRKTCSALDRSSWIPRHCPTS